MTRPAITFDTSALDHLLDELGDAAEAAARPAAQAGAEVLYRAVKRNVAALGTKTGNLARSIYQVYSRDNSAQGRAVYHVSWNHKRAPHGHLVEHGHLQRYKLYKDDQGRIRPMVRPGMDGTPPPGRRASQAEKDAYYVPLPGGPRQVGAQPFIRPAMDYREQATQAAEAELLRRLKGQGA